jgi:hypothetical protein
MQKVQICFSESLLSLFMGFTCLCEVARLSVRVRGLVCVIERDPEKKGYLGMRDEKIYP